MKSKGLITLTALLIISFIDEILLFAGISILEIPDSHKAILVILIVTISVIAIKRGGKR